MGDYVAPDGGLIAIWNGVSDGTRGMITYARQLSLQVYVHMVTNIADNDTGSGIVGTGRPGANMYGCQPCPRCGDKKRYVNSGMRQHITCGACSHIEPITQEIF